MDWKKGYPFKFHMHIDICFRNLCLPCYASLFHCEHDLPFPSGSGSASHRLEDQLGPSSLVSLSITLYLIF